MKILHIKQSIGAIIITWLEIALAASCIVLFFFPIFTLLDAEMFPMVTLSQFRMLFGGNFECGQVSNQTINAVGNTSFLVGFLVPMFMILILYYRRIIRPFFAYLLHALISIALLFYIFTTCSVAGGIVRDNASIVNTYKLTKYWYILAIIVFVGLLLSILLVVFDIYRLKNRQKKFEKQEAEGETEEEAEEAEEEKSKKEPEIEKNTDSDDILSDEENYEEEEQEEPNNQKTVNETENDRINRSVREAIAGRFQKKNEKAQKFEPVAHISTEISSEEIARKEKAEVLTFDEDDAETKPEEKEPVEKCTVKVKAKVKPASSGSKSNAPQRSNAKRPNVSEQSAAMRRRTASHRVRASDDDFDINSGY